MFCSDFVSCVCFLSYLHPSVGPMVHASSQLSSIHLIIYSTCFHFTNHPPSLVFILLSLVIVCWIPLLPHQYHARYFFRIALYLAPSIFPSTLIPVPSQEKHPHSMILSLPCVTVEDKMFRVMCSVSFCPHIAFFPLA
ncbi:hypothetical protein ATANTOWER_028127 [Ataeniobius toweri]|uniref:Uncharacterized protein n=1 Tax=Ataeniobius toweri TaxID=208326 RepID=A0ABU7B357_9TELE|nr:hypothetical protein [Ataeniobius toweri]